MTITLSVVASTTVCIKKKGNKISVQVCENFVSFTPERIHVVAAESHISPLSNDVIYSYTVMDGRLIILFGQWNNMGLGPSFSLARVRNRLAEVFGHRVIASHYDVEWPPLSPDLTCQFFLWGYLKSKVFTTPPTDIATLRQRIIDEFDALRHQAPMICRAVCEMEK